MPTPPSARIALVTLVVLAVAAVAGCDAIQQARNAEYDKITSNNMKHVVLALHLYHDEYRSFPPAYAVDADGTPLYSWRVLILPYLEHRAVYEQFHRDEPWDSPHNKQLLGSMPPSFESPFLDKTKHPGETPYLAIASAESVLNTDHPVAFRDITDGTSNTIAFVADLSHPVPWTEPVDLTPEDFLQLDLDATPVKYTQIAMADGSVQRFNNSAKKSLENMVDIAGGKR